MNEIKGLAEVAATPGGLTVTGALIVALVGIVRGWWITGREHTESRNDWAARLAERDAENARLRIERDAAVARVDAMATAAEHALDRLAAATNSSRSKGVG